MRPHAGFVTRSRCYCAEAVAGGIRHLAALLALLLLFPAVSAGEGDCNGDGKLSSADALMALKMAVGEREPSRSCDVDGDGRVTSSDAAEILLLVVGRDECELLVERVRGVAEGAEVKGLASLLAGDQRIGVEAGECSFGVVVKSGRVEEVKQGGVENPTLTARTSYETLERLLDTGSAEELKNAVESGEVEVRARGALNRLKLGVAKLALNIM
jgi:hypothetical protein